MLDIDNKFEIGQEVYVIRKEKTKDIAVNKIDVYMRRSIPVIQK